MSANCDIIIFFLIYGQFAAIRKPDTGRMVYKTYIFINSNFYLTNPENRTKKSLIQLSYYCFEQGCSILQEITTKSILSKQGA